jgi:hypothetical protein
MARFGAPFFLERLENAEKPSKLRNIPDQKTLASN